MGSAYGTVLNQSYQKYRLAYTSDVVALETGKVFGGAGWSSTVLQQQDRAGLIKGRRRVPTREFYAARRLATDNPSVVFEETATNFGILYEIRTKHQGVYNDVEDGFTERRDNYDETSVTVQQLAEQVKTLKRDLIRAGVLGRV